MALCTWPRTPGAARKEFQRTSQTNTNRWRNILCLVVCTRRKLTLTIGRVLDYSLTFEENVEAFRACHCHPSSFFILRRGAQGAMTPEKLPRVRGRMAEKSSDHY
jgi:hypothetical protein